jgi:hypothetical protein
LITLSRSHLKCLRRVFSRALNSRRAAQVPVQFQVALGKLTIAVQDSEVSVAYSLPMDVPERSFAVPLELLKRCAGTKDEPVTLELADREVIARWSDAGIPQVAPFQRLEPADLPSLPVEMADSGADFLAAMQAACETTDPESVRYALGCVQLRGSDGSIIATDGRQLLIQRGFAFPWDDAILVPACRVFGCKEIASGGPIAIGRTDDWSVLTVGPWTIHLKIQKDARYPQVDDHVPASGSAKAVVRLNTSDAAFLGEAIHRLPCSDSHNQAVTLDLNGQVILRSRGSDGMPTTDLVLTGSRLEGEPLRACTNRQFLARAVELGFDSVELRSADDPVCCRDERRTYVWALLSKESILKQDENAVRIESPVPSVSKPRPPRQVVVPAAQSPSEPAIHRPQRPIRPRQQSAPAEPPVGVELIATAQRLRQSLKSAASELGTIVAGLKEQQRQSRRLRAAVKSLKQVQAIDV